MARILLVHGLGGTGATMLPVADALAARGNVVHAPTLPGHGTTVEDLRRTTWRQWVDAVRAWCDEFAIDTVIGQSMGGCLALATGSEIGIHDPARRGPPTVRRLVAINAPVPDPDALDGLEWRRSRGHDTVAAPPLAPGEVGYTSLPITALLEMVAGVLTLDLASVTMPVLLMNSRHDDVVDPATACVLASSLAGPVRRVELGESGHVATLGDEVEQIVDAVLCFLGHTA